MANLRGRLKEYTDKLKGLGGPSDALEKQMSGLLERATSEMWISPDWGLNMELVDLVNSNQGGPTYEKLFRTLRRRLALRNPKVQLLVLTVLETCVKNCGSAMHAALGGSELWGDVVRLADPRRRGDLEVQDRALVMVEDFAASLRPEAFQRAAADLRGAGVRFPQRPEGEVGLGIGTEAVEPPRAIGGVSEADQIAIQAALRDLERAAPDGDPGARAPTVVASVPAGPAGDAHADLRAARNATDLLVDALGSVPGHDPSAVRQDFIADLAARCGEVRPRLTRVIEGAGDGPNLAEGLAIFDDLTRALDRYEELRAATGAGGPGQPAQREGALPALVTDRGFPHQPAAGAGDLLPGLAGSPRSADSSTTAQDGFAALAAGEVRGRDGFDELVAARSPTARTGAGDGFDELVAARSPRGDQGGQGTSPRPLQPPRPQPPPRAQAAPDQTGDLITF